MRGAAARGFLALTVLALFAGEACATGTSLEDTAFVGGDDFDGGSTSQTEAGSDAGVLNGGKDASTGSETSDSGGPSATDSGDTSGMDSGAPCVGAVVINEVQTDGAKASDEFVELYNPASCALSLKGYELGYYSAGGVGQTDGTPYVYFTGTAAESIPAHGYFVLAGADFAGSSDDKLTGGLKDDAGRIGITDSSGKLLDAVGYGTLTGSTTLYVEGKSAPSPVSSKSIGRKPDGTDTNKNSADFVALATPSPGAAN